MRQIWMGFTYLGIGCLAQYLVDLPHGAVYLILKILQVVLAALDGCNL